MLLLLVLSVDDEKVVIVADEFFLLYDFVTTGLWFVQASLQTLASPPSFQQSWGFWVEWILSAVFLLMTANAVYMWQIDDASTLGNVLEALANLIAYTWLAVYWNRILQERQNTEEDTANDYHAVS